jgi:class 3 adenylate cyclase
MLVGRYRGQVVQVVDRFGGHIGSAKGDGLRAVFGHPTAHEDDVRRAGLEITREVARPSAQAKRRFGIEIHGGGHASIFASGGASSRDASSL